MSPPAGADALYSKLPFPIALYITAAADDVGLGDREVPVSLEVVENEPVKPPGAAEDEVPVIVVLLTEELLRDDAAIYPMRLALS